MEIRALIIGLFLVAGCGGTKSNDERIQRGRVENLEVPLLSAQRLNRLAVVTSAYRGKIGELKWINLPAHQMFTPAEFVSSDTFLRAPAGSPWLYVINRLHYDNIQLFERTSGKMVHQTKISVPFLPGGEGPNVYDVAEGKEGIYVSSLNSNFLVRIDPISGKEFERIDLSSEADSADNNAEVSFLHRRGDQLLIVLERLDRADKYHWKPKEKGRVVAIDMNTRIQKKIDLVGRNPSSPLQEGPDGTLYIAEKSIEGLGRGGIEKLNKTTFLSEGIVIEESKLGGNPEAFEIIDDTHGVAIVTTPSGGKKLVTFNPSTGDDVRLVEESPDYDSFQSLLYDRERKLYYLGMRGAKSGIRVLRADLTEWFRYDVKSPPVATTLME
jgi:hypothetical protein